jgi:hypothetical protein
MKTLLFYLFILAAFISSGCYTVIKRDRQLQIESSKYLNSELVGEWTGRNNYSDSKGYTSMIEFQPDGDFYFYPLYPGEAYKGYFNIKDKRNIVEIRLLNNQQSELFKYSVRENSLILKRAGRSVRQGISILDGDHESFMNRNYKYEAKDYTR